MYIHSIELHNRVIETEQKMSSTNAPPSLHSSKKITKGNDRTSLNRSQGGSSEESQEVQLFVQDLLEQMQTKFTDMGNSVIGRMDELGSRMEELEGSIAQLMEEVGIEPTNGSVQTSNGRFTDSTNNNHDMTQERTSSTQAHI